MAHQNVIGTVHLNMYIKKYLDKILSLNLNSNAAADAKFFFAFAGTKIVENNARAAGLYGDGKCI